MVICRTTSVLTCLFLLLGPNGLSYAENSAAHRVKVTIIHREASIHTSISNRDAYLVRIMPKSGRAFVARIVDQYPAYSDAPGFSPTRDEISISVALRRAPYCDEGGNDDDGERMVQCFEVVHESWRFPKAAIEEQWWR
jgi:hypothetical protein